MTTQIETSKIVTYELLSQQDARTSKIATYAVLKSTDIHASKVNTYMILKPVTTGGGQAFLACGMF